MVDQDINKLIETFREELGKLRSSSQLDEASKKHQQNIEKLLERNNKLSQEGVDKSKDQDFNALLEETQKTNKQLKEDKKTAKLLDKLNQNQEENNQITKENLKKNSKAEQLKKASSDKVSKTISSQLDALKQGSSDAGKNLGMSIAGTALKGQFDNGIKSVPSSGSYMLEQGERVVSSELNKDLTSYLAQQQRIGFGNQGETDKDIMMNVQNPEPVNNAMQGLTTMSNNEDKDGLKVKSPDNKPLNATIDKPDNIFDGVRLIFRDVIDNFTPYHRESTGWYKSINSNIRSLQDNTPRFFYESLILSYKEFMRYPIWNTIALGLKGLTKMVTMVVGPIGRLIRNVLIGSEASIDKKQLNQLQDINNVLYQVYDVQARRRGFEGFVEEGGLGGIVGRATKEAGKTVLSSSFNAVKGLFPSRKKKEEESTSEVTVPSSLNNQIEYLPSIDQGISDISSQLNDMDFSNIINTNKELVGAVKESNNTVSDSIKESISSVSDTVSSSIQSITESSVWENISNSVGKLPSKLDQMVNSQKEVQYTVTNSGIVIEGDFAREDGQGNYRTTSERRSTLLQEAQAKSQGKMAVMLVGLKGMFGSFTSLYDKRSEEMIEGQDGSSGWLSVIGRALMPVAGLLGSGFAMLKSSIGKHLGKLSGLFKAKGAIGGVMGLGKGLLSRIPGLTMIFDFVQMLTNLFSGDFSNIGENLGQIIGAGLGGVLGSIFGPVGTAVGAALGRFLFGHIGESIQTAFQESDGFFSFIGIFFKDIAMKAWEGIKWLATKISNAFDWAWSFLESIPFIGQLFITIRKMNEAFQSIIIGIWTYGIKPLGTAIGWVWDYVIKPIGSTISWIWSNVISPLVSGIGWLIGAIADFDIVKTFKDVRYSFMSGLTKFMNGVISAVNTMLPSSMEYEKFEMPTKPSESSGSESRRNQPRVPEDMPSRNRQTAQPPMLTQQGQQQDQQNRTKEQEVLASIDQNLKNLNRTTEEGNKNRGQAPTPEPNVDDVNTALMLSFQ